LITDVFRSRPLLCTIHHLINFTLVSVENVPKVPWEFRARSSNNTARYCRTWATVSEPWRFTFQKAGVRVLKME